MNCIYRLYTRVFWCYRRVQKAIYEKTSKEMQLPEATWLSLTAVYSDGSMVDVTDDAMGILITNEFVTPDILEKMLDLPGVHAWFYLTKSLEYSKITTDGVLNGL